MNRPKTVFLYCGIFMLTSEIWKQWCLTYLLGAGHYNWWYFPFQLCSIPMYLCLALPFIHSEKLTSVFLTFLMDYSLLAGVFTFFDTSGLYYPYLPLTVHSYLWHILLIALGLYAGHTKKADYSSGGFVKSSGLYLSCCLLATICNLAFYSYGPINMFYISPHYHMSQKVFRHIALKLGNTAGILIYMACVMSGAGLVHLIWKYRYQSHRS